MKRDTQKAINAGQEILDKYPFYDITYQDILHIQNNNADEIDRLIQAFKCGVAIGDRIAKKNQA